MMVSRALLSAATRQRRQRLLHSSPSCMVASFNCIATSLSQSNTSWLPTSQSPAIIHCANNNNNPSRRSFATKNKKGNKKQDVYKQQIKAQQSQSSSSSSIIGKRPGQTSFSPPKDRIVSSQPTAKSTAIQYYPSLTANKPKGAKPNNSTSVHATPLVLPPLLPDETTTKTLNNDTFSGDRDNKHYAHTQPSMSPIAMEQIEKEDNALRELFLKQGILPPPERPVIDSSKRNDTQSTVDMPSPDPSGVSHANPEDVINMASMYDPSIHLPDKPNFNTPSNRTKYEAGTPLTDELIAYIGVRGPITCAEFMRRVLRDGEFGYYTSKGSRSGTKATIAGDSTLSATDDDVDDDNDWDLEDGDTTIIHTQSADSTQKVGGEQIIGTSGDFITAPEVSQLFGESLLVWLMTQYQTCGSPSKIQIIEIGPGKGTLICDMLRSAVATFPDFAEALSASSTSDNDSAKEEGVMKKGKVAVGVHLVEVANGMRARQKESIQNLEREESMAKKGYSFQFADDDVVLVGEQSKVAHDSDSSSDSNKEDTEEQSSNSINVSWHDVLSSVPTHDPITNEPIPTFIICQELVDALPVHSFQKTEEGVWRERLVDVAVRDDDEAGGAAEDVRLAAVASARKSRYASAEESTTADAVPASTTSSNETAQSSEIMKKIPRLRFVLPPDTTPALRSMLRVTNSGSPIEDEHNPMAQALNALPPNSIIEACPEGLLLVQDIADRITKCAGGAALIIDYGGDGSSGGDTLRGFYKHGQVHPLSLPGEVDVTADVDFGALREAVNRRVGIKESLERKKRNQKGGGTVSSASESAGGDVTNDVGEEEGGKPNKAQFLKPEAFGPITQGKFLAQMGIVQRVEKKIEDPDTTDEEAYELYTAMERLMVPEEMGERYKVLAIAAKKEGLFPPPGF